MGTVELPTSYSWKNPNRILVFGRNDFPLVSG